MVEASDRYSRLTALAWDGEEFISYARLSTAAYYYYPCFDLRFEPFKAPIEQAVEVEFKGVSDLGLWTSLKWGCELSVSEGSAKAVLQLYDYEAGSYPTSGPGYQSLTVTSDDVEAFQELTSSLERFRGSDGSWMMRLKVTREARPGFNVKVDLSEYFRRYDACKAEVEVAGTTGVASYEWSKLRWLVDLATNVTDVSIRLQLYDYEASSYPTSGEGFDSFTVDVAGVDYTRESWVEDQPKSFTSLSGDWRVKVSACILNHPPDVNYFELRLDQVCFEPEFFNESGVDVTFQFLDVSPEPEPSQVSFELVLSSTRATTCYLYVWNYTKSEWSLMDVIELSGAGRASFTAPFMDVVSEGEAMVRVVAEEELRASS